jgi:hypothetical protein
MGINSGVRGIEGDRYLSVMPILHQILGRVCKGHVGIQIAPLLGESFDPTVGRKAVIVTGVADYEGCLMY